MKLKHLYTLIFLIQILINVNAQQDPQYTQYMYNTMSVNPAYAGSSGHTIINALARTQWVGIEGAPDTQTLSFDTPLGFSGVGLGINLTNDRIGPANEIFLDINASYTVRTSDEGNLAFGLKLGARHLNVDWNKGIVKDRDDKSLTGNINRFLPTIGAGIYYYTSNWYLGAAIPNFINTDHYDDSNNGGDVAKERIHLFLIGGYVFDLNESIKFKPAFLTKVVNGAPLSLDVSANFLFNEKFTAGIAWRWDDSISALIGLQASRNLHIGLAYDLTTSNYSNYNSGTYELMIKWEIFKELAMKSPRFF
ncbi:PorP/SprF family type IX secretion system membrane protein [Tenacibaculum mesophilum]|uniref:Type IX secretion system membrane protein PorP/SprF n=2 Tax=Tenacibaculum TaxID=104267 RepID=A0AAE9MLV0_9FLAO|nr:type IX secretion system membrane protein PorP/SprF [Tenacibaculum mesophilum]GFD76875.1 membrane protein [Tenacibaculum sp. KUL113]GFD91694.1 membrane protein [Alteromonas sp. KUL154]GFE01380.1 membrane protein [Alteromonas sp. KUL156]AZJ32660.1 type IX secretion system membrane protein PorP/SprF [Tenacibaculum mesophilum]QFS27912.1 type IX secretion system membrane protein PorP/SprF [Tenacibaculum mesophilum]